MARFEESVVINRPADQVFAFVSDLENDPPWTSVAEMRRMSEGPLGVGSTFRQRARFLGVRLDLSLEVVGFEPNHSITVRTESGFLSFEGTRVVEPVGDAVARVRCGGHGHAHGVWRLVEPLLVAVGVRQLRGQLGRLKQLLEAPS